MGDIPAPTTALGDVFPNGQSEAWEECNVSSLDTELWDRDCLGESWRFSLSPGMLALANLLIVSLSVKADKPKVSIGKRLCRLLSHCDYGWWTNLVLVENDNWVSRNIVLFSLQTAAAYRVAPLRRLLLIVSFTSGDHLAKLWCSMQTSHKQCAKASQMADEFLFPF